MGDGGVTGVVGNGDKGVVEDRRRGADGNAAGERAATTGVGERLSGLVRSYRIITLLGRDRTVQVNQTSQRGVRAPGASNQN